MSDESPEKNQPNEVTPDILAHIGPDETVATLGATPGRRLFAIAVLAILGIILLYTAATEPFTPVGRMALIGLGGFAIFGSERLRRVTLNPIRLTPTALYDGEDEVIFYIADVKTLDRGVLAFKPSNGFMVRLTTKQKRGWAPGVWWRLGRFVGVGGVTQSSDAKMMSELIAVMVAQDRAIKQANADAETSD